MISTIFYLLWTVFIGSTVVQIFFWLYFFRRLAFYDVTCQSYKFNNNNQTKTTLIICVKNEEENLKNLFPRFLSQSYRSLDMLIVDDNSDDNSYAILSNYRNKNPIFEVLKLGKESLKYNGKKYALTQGILHTKSENILLSDADCWPVDQKWSQIMIESLGEKSIGLGYSPYKRYPGFLNLFIRYEAAYTAIQYFSFALAGLPYMGVGRNLIYKRELFIKAGGFKDHIDIASGDDDLFINSIANSDNTTVILHPKSFILSEPKKSWTSYYRQKMRHNTTGINYKPIHQFLLGLLATSHILHYFGGITLAFYDFNIVTTVIIFAIVRLLIIMLLSKYILKKLGHSHMLLWVPFLDVLYLVYYLVFALALMNTNKKRWN